ncbi:MAG: LamG domain-containing protein [Planctomycetota bacterium]
MRPELPRDQPAPAPPCFETLEARQLFAVDLGGSLIAHWTFEDNSATPASFADVSPDGSDHPATLQGDAQSVPQNQSNRVLQLDGSGDYLSVANDAEINLSIHTQRSIAFWFRVDDASLNIRKQVIYEEGGTTRGLIIYVYDDQLYVGGWNRDGSQSGWAGTWLNTAGIQSGRWHHVTLTLDGQATTTPDALSGYLDGQRFAQGEGSQLWTRSGSITVGNHSDGTRFHDGDVGTLTAGFAGQLDDGRLYNRALTPADVLLLARGPAVSLSRQAVPPEALAIHETQYVLIPEAAIDPAQVSPPERINAEQTPDFPGRAWSGSSTVVPDQVTGLATPEIEAAALWASLSSSLGFWPGLSDWVAEQLNAGENIPEVADVDPDAGPLR